MGNKCPTPEHRTSHEEREQDTPSPRPTPVTPPAASPVRREHHPCECFFCKLPDSAQALLVHHLPPRYYTALMGISPCWAQRLLSYGTWAFAWGRNDYRQLGDTTNTHRSHPTLLRALLHNHTVTSLAGGFYHSLALTAEGRVLSWGSDSFGQLGARGGEGGLPCVVAGALEGHRVTAIAACWCHSLALTADGLVFAWGWNKYGQLGDGTAETHAEPVPVQGPWGPLRITHIAAGNAFSLALAEDGALYAWGKNTAGQLGCGEGTQSLVPVRVAGPLAEERVAHMDAGIEHALAVTTNGDVYAWGSNANHRLGTGSNEERRALPVKLTMPRPVRRTITRVACADHSMALSSTGVLCAWGDGKRKVPTALAALPITPVRIECGLGFSVAADDHAAYTWGKNEFGQLGCPEAAKQPHCVLPAPLSHLRIAVGEAHVFAWSVPAPM